MKLALPLLLFTATALAQSSNSILVLNKTGNTLSFVNARSLAVDATVAVGQNPHELAISSNGEKAYVANAGGNSISVIDLKARSETKKITSPDFSFPHGVAFTPDSKRAIVTSERKKKILIIDAVRDEILRSIDTDQEGTHMVVISADGRWAYLTNRGSATVSVMDLDDYKIVANIVAGKGVEGIALAPDGKQLWVGNRDDNTITVIDTAKRQPVATLPAGRAPIRAAFTPDGRMVFVPNSGSGDVFVYDVAARKHVKTIPVGGNPGGVIVSRDGGRAFVACAATNEIQVLDTQALTVSAKVAVGQGPDGIAYR